MVRHNHAFGIAFSVISSDEQGRDVDTSQLRAALMARIADLDREGGWVEATGVPYESYPEPEGDAP